VDVQRVLSDIGDSVAVKASLKKEFATRQSMLDVENEIISGLSADLDEETNGDTRSKKTAEIKRRSMLLQKLTRQHQSELKEMDSKLTRSLLIKIGEVVRDVSRTEGVDVTYGQDVAVLYARTVVDLTGKVIKAYDEACKPACVTPPD
jgi:Skp family chaperone for outer membrane proteins